MDNGDTVRCYACQMETEPAVVAGQIRCDECGSLLYDGLERYAELNPLKLYHVLHRMVEFSDVSENVREMLHDDVSEAVRLGNKENRKGGDDE